MKVLFHLFQNTKMQALNIQQHKTHLTNILIDIYKDTFLGSTLGFKGGTAAMLFHDLPRFSVDLDFDVTQAVEKKSNTLQEITSKITLLLETKYEIKDSSQKFNTLFWLVSYGAGSINIKIEVSTRENPFNTYELKPFYGVSVKKLHIEDMIAHKLVAATDRTSIAHRDLFDIHYFLSSKYVNTINYDVIKHRTGKNPKEFYVFLSEFLKSVDNKNILQGLGEVLTESQKDWAKAKLLIELKGLVQRQMDLVE